MQKVTRAEKSFIGRRTVLWKKKKCKSCSKEFQPANFGQMYCSFACIPPKPKPNRQNGIKLGVKTVRRRICENCGKEFYRHRSQELYRGKGRFCSRKCKFERGLATVGSVDAAWSELVKIKAGKKCEYCGKTETLNSHHLFSRSNRATRWEENNGVCLCVAHHIFGNFSAHKAPMEFLEWIKEKRGEEWYKNLREQARSTVKIDKNDFRGIKDKLQARIKELSGL